MNNRIWTPDTNIIIPPSPVVNGALNHIRRKERQFLREYKLAYTHVSASQASSAAVTDLGTLAYAQNVGNNVLLTAEILIGSNTIDCDDIAGDLGETWIRAVRRAHASVGRSVEIWYAFVATGGANSPIFNWSAASTCRVTLNEFTGFDFGVTLDQTNGQDNASGTTHNCGSISPTIAESVMIAMYGISTSGWVVSAREAGYNVITNQDFLCPQYKLDTSGGVTDGDITFSTSRISCACIANFYTPVPAGGDVRPKPISVVSSPRMEYYQ